MGPPLDAGEEPQLRACPRRRGGGLQTQPPNPSFGFMRAQRIGDNVPAPTAR